MRTMLKTSTMLACLGYAASAGAQTAPQVMRAQDFVNSIGVDTHIPYTDGAYANPTTIINDLAYVGINHIRDGLNAPGQFGSAPLSSYVAIARAGVHMTLLVGGGGSFTSTGGVPTDPSLDQRIGYIDQLVQAVPGSVDVVEGTNEINNQPIVFNGQGSSGQGTDELNATLAMQRELYSRVHADANLKGVPVAYFTGYAAGSIPVGPDPAATPGLADFDTQHPYPNGGQPPLGWVVRKQALGNETAAEAAALAPAVYTETGYTSLGGTAGGVNPDVQAKYTMDLLFDTASQGIAQTDLYELMDAYAPGSPQGDSGWGLFDYTGKPKPVALALHNFNALLTDTGATATTFKPVALAYTVTGEDATGHHLLMAKSDGSYVLALWNEKPIWNQSTGSQLAATAHRVQVNLTNSASSKTVSFSPMQRTMPTAVSYSPHISLTVTDSPVLLAISSAPR